MRNPPIHFIVFAIPHKKEIPSLKRTATPWLSFLRWVLWSGYFVTVHFAVQLQLIGVEVKVLCHFHPAHDIFFAFIHDLQGVIDKLDYLQDLGVEVIYFNPLFVSPSILVDTLLVQPLVKGAAVVKHAVHNDPHPTAVREEVGFSALQRGRLEAGRMEKLAE